MAPLSRRRRAIHPIHNVSSEILSIIFQHSLPDFDPSYVPEDIYRGVSGDPDTGYQIASTDAPLNVSATCRNWRNVALSTPSLWNLICVVYPEADEDDERFEQVTRERLNTWIPRSGTLALSIFVKCYRNHCLQPENPDLPPNLVFSLLLECKERWGSVFIHAPESQIWELLLTSDESPAPKLKIIEIKDSSLLPKPVRLPLDLGKRLRGVERINFVGKSMWLDGPLPTVKYLKAKVSAADLSSLVLQLPQLEMMSLKYTGSQEESPTTLVELPNLQELVLSFFHEEPIKEYQENPFFTNLMMPGLTDLRVSITGQTNCFLYLLRDISKLMAVSHPVLRSFEVFFEPGYRSERIKTKELPKLYDLFRRMPSLRSLELPEAARTKAVLQKCVKTARKDVVLPSLQVLWIKTRISEVKGKADGKQFVKAMETLIRSRRGDGDSESFTVFFLDENCSFHELYSSRDKLIFSPNSMRPVAAWSMYITQGQIISKY